MKNTITLFIMCFAFITNAQSDHFKYTNALKLSIFEFARDEIQLSYERFLGENRTKSLIITPSLIYKSQNDETKTGFQLMSQYRFYVSQVRSDERNTFLGMYNIGFYAGPYAQGLIYSEDYLYSYWNNTGGQYMESIFTKDIKSVEGGVIIGLQFDITSRILMDFFVGGGIRYSKVDDTFDISSPDIYRETYNIFDQEYNGVKPKIGFQVGITF